MVGMAIGVFLGLLLHDAFNDATDLIGRWVRDERDYWHHPTPPKPPSAMRRFFQRIGY